jgi:hypothetical protein
MVKKKTITLPKGYTPTDFKKTDSKLVMTLSKEPKSLGWIGKKRKSAKRKNSRYKKGSIAAKRYMARLRNLKKPKSKSKHSKGSVTMAKRRYRRTRTKRRSRRSGFGLGGLLSKDTLLLGVGAGASGALGGLVKQYAPQVPDNYAEAVAAVGLVMFGGKLHPALKTVGKGAMIKVIGDLVEAQVMPQLFKKGTTANSGW